MTHLTLVGVDPGLVDTGFTKISISGTTWTIEQKVENSICELAIACKDADTIFVEDFRTRLVAVDSEMIHKQREILMALPDDKLKLVSNSGVKQIITEELMKALDLWEEPHLTHHYDIRSSARILLYGMVQDKLHGYNELLAKKVKKHV